MDPITMMMGATQVIGLGMSMFGMSSASSASGKIADASRNIAGLETQKNDQRKQQMVLQANRNQLETIRNQQRAISAGLATSTSQGAQQGSGLGGAYGQAQGQGDSQRLGVAQNLMIGKNMFAIDDQINKYRGDIASYQGDQAQGQGFMSMGGDLMKSAGPLSQLFGQFGGAAGGAAGSMSAGNIGGTGGNLGGFY